MKREHCDLHLQDPFCGGGGGGGGSRSSSSAAGGSSSSSDAYLILPPPPEPLPAPEIHGKSKMWPEEDKDAGAAAGVDELLALSGYMVKSSDMVVVAQNIEKLEQAIGKTQEDSLVSHLSSLETTVHYNPADLSSWLSSMISGINPFTGFGDASTSNSSIRLPFPPPVAELFEDSSSSDYDLKAIPGKAVFPSQLSPPKKRLKHYSSPPSFSPSITSPPPPPPPPSHSPWGLIPNDSTRPIVLVDSQENGVRLVHALVACAEAVQQDDLCLAEAMVQQVGFLALSQSGAMRKVATYFAEALARRIYRVFPENPSDFAFSDRLLMHFYEACPYLKFAHFTANQAILEAFTGKKRVHVIDFSLKEGMQWPALMQALALQPGGPPSFRLTGIGPPSADGSDHVHEVGWKLAQMADMVNVEFEFSGFITDNLSNLSPSMLNLREGESLAINSVLELHRLLSRQGSIEKVLNTIKEMNPDIVTVVEQEANHNGPIFLDRFTESLHYYSTMFDSLESCNNNSTDMIPLDAAAAMEAAAMRNQNKLMSEDYLGRQICNVVGCEGAERVERHERLTQWRDRLNSAGLEPVHMGSNAYKQASMLLALFNGDGYRVEENDGCLLLGWHNRPLIATSAWTIA